jgi:DNA methylase
VGVAVAPTQEALYDEIDLELSWSERELPERDRTKHVHRLHPYLGKFIPQLVEALLARHVPAGGRVLDPFAGSGTTLVQALESGYDATGADIAAFNCLLMRVKTRTYNLFVLEREVRDVIGRLESGEGETGDPPAYAEEWSRRRPWTSCSASAGCSTATSTPMSCASCSPGGHARHG